MSATAVAAPVPFTIHASAVVIGENAVLLRGPSGVGKSALALALLDAASARGRFAMLVADDRVVLRPSGGRLIIAPHAAIAGRVERRFVGLADITHEQAAVARLLVDLSPTGPRSAVARLPEQEVTRIMLHGIVLPRLVFPAGHSGAVEAILHRLQELAS